MERVYSLKDHLPIKSWCSEIEQEALNQAKNLALLPFAFHHIALMPDCHTGYGMPIGGVLATENVIVPNAVGVDIGCSVRFLRFGIKASEVSTDTIKQILSDIKKEIPMGTNSGEMKDYLLPNSPCSDFIYSHESRSKQIGTLGGGNHFIEFQKNLNDELCLMIHSGSRNLGKVVGDRYNNIAKELNEKWFSSVPLKYNLAFLPVDIYQGNDYIMDMKYCVAYALANRKQMTDIITHIVSTHVNGASVHETIDVAHNYARLENHFGKNVWVHRKGATSARKDEIGIIPSSQGTPSYIVKGLGNPDSFMSCSHGAGRAMSRTKARENLDLTLEIAKMDSIGIIHDMKSVSDLDEASGAYKDINVVMENQNDLVTIVDQLIPIAVLKG